MPSIQIPQAPVLKFAAGGAVPKAGNVETVNFNWNVNGQRGTVRTLMQDRQELDRFVTNLHEAGRGLK